MMVLKDAYNYSVQYLQGNGIDEPDFKALCAVCHIAGISNGQYPLHKDDIIDESRLHAMLTELRNGRPIQYVIGRWTFYDSDFIVGEGVLIPRPETEELVDLALDVASGYAEPIIYDLCSGSGCIARTVAAHIPDATVYAIEKSDAAYKYLYENCADMRNMVLINGDIATDIDIPYDADIILSNPPYVATDDILTLQDEVRQEPLMALDGGRDGLDFYRIICAKWMPRLKPEGILIMEIGNEQRKGIERIFREYPSVEIKRDIYGNDRIAVVKKTEW